MPGNTTDHTGRAALAHLGQHGGNGFFGQRQVLALGLAGALELGLQQRRGDCVQLRHQNSGRSQASMGITSPRRRLAVTDCADSSQCTMVGAVIAPDGNACQRVVEGVEQAGNALSGQTHRVEPGQRG